MKLTANQFCGVCLTLGDLSVSEVADLFRPEVMPKQEAIHDAAEELASRPCIRRQLERFAEVMEWAETEGTR